MKRKAVILAVAVGIACLVVSIVPHHVRPRNCYYLKWSAMGETHHVWTFTDGVRTMRIDFSPQRGLSVSTNGL